jgi:WD40 repeat protein
VKKILLFLLFLAVAQYLDASENLILQIPGGTQSIRTCGFLDNNTVAVPTDDNKLTPYSLAGQKQNGIPAHRDMVNTFDCSTEYFATGAADNVVFQYQTDTRNVFRNYYDHAGAVELVRFAPDGKTLVSFSCADNIVSAHNPATGGSRFYISNTEPIITVAPGFIITDGSGLREIGCHLAASLKDDPVVELWKMKSDTHHEMYLRLIGHTASVESIDWHPDGMSLATGSADSTVKMWDSNTGTTIHTFEDYRGSRTPVRYSPDGTLIAAGSESQIGVYDTRVPRRVLELVGHLGRTNALGWSPDGTKLASCADGEVKVWDVRQPSKLVRFLRKCQKLAANCLSPEV